MSTIVRTFTEDPWTLFLLLALAELLLVVTVKRRGQGVWLKLVIAVPIVAVGLLVLEWLIVTDREELQANVRAAARALQDEEMETFLVHFSPAYEFAGLDYETLQRWTQAFADTYKLKSTTFFWHEVKVVAGKGLVEFSVLTTGEVHGVDYGPNKSRWQLEFRREGTPPQWKISKVRVVHIPGLKATTLLGVVRAAIGL